MTAAQDLQGIARSQSTKRLGQTMGSDERIGQVITYFLLQLFCVTCNFFPLLYFNRAHQLISDPWTSWLNSIIFISILLLLLFLLHRKILYFTSCISTGSIHVISVQVGLCRLSNYDHNRHLVKVKILVKLMIIYHNKIKPRKPQGSVTITFISV